MSIALELIKTDPIASLTYMITHMKEYTRDNSSTNLNKLVLFNAYTCPVGGGSIGKVRFDYANAGKYFNVPKEDLMACWPATHKGRKSWDTNYDTTAKHSAVATEVSDMARDVIQELTPAKGKANPVAVILTLLEREKKIYSRELLFPESQPGGKALANKSVEQRLAKLEMQMSKLLAS